MKFIHVYLRLVIPNSNSNSNICDMDRNFNILISIKKFSSLQIKSNLFKKIKRIGIPGWLG